VYVHTYIFNYITNILLLFSFELSTKCDGFKLSIFYDYLYYNYIIVSIECAVSNDALFKNFILTLSFEYNNECMECESSIRQA